MNKNAVIILSIIAIVLLGGGLIYAINRTVNVPTPTTTSTTPVVTTPTTQPVQSSAPIVITNDTAYPSDTTVVLTGSVNPGGAFTSYWYEYGKSLALGQKTSVQLIGSGFASLPAPAYITNLSNNTTYYFRLVGTNQSGTVAGNTYSFKTSTTNPPPVGSAPVAKTIAATNISNTSATIRAEVTPNRAITQYWFEYGSTTQLGNTSVLAAAGDGSVMVNVSSVITNLAPVTTYYFRINAQNQFGTVNGTILNFKTAGPALPKAPTVISQNATSIASTSATLSGTINPNGDTTKYWFEYSTNPALSVALISKTDTKTLTESTTTSSVNADITNLTTKTTYYFRLVGQNSLGIVKGDIRNFKTK